MLVKYYGLAARYLHLILDHQKLDSDFTADWVLVQTDDKVNNDCIMKLACFHEDKVTDCDMIPKKSSKYVKIGVPAVKAVCCIDSMTLWTCV